MQGPRPPTAIGHITGSLLIIRLNCFLFRPAAGDWFRLVLHLDGPPCRDPRCQLLNELADVTRVQFLCGCAALPISSGTERRSLGLLVDIVDYFAAAIVLIVFNLEWKDDNSGERTNLERQDLLLGARTRTNQECGPRSRDRNFFYRRKDRVQDRGPRLRDWSFLWDNFFFLKTPSRCHGGAYFKVDVRWDMRVIYESCEQFKIILGFLTMNWINFI